MFLGMQDFDFGSKRFNFT